MTDSDATAVLVVDDDPAVCNFLRCVLEKKGYSVDMAFDAAETIRRLTSRRYQVAILDFNLPGGDGKFIFQHLRAMNPELARHVLLITGEGYEERLIHFISTHDLPVLRKPFNPDELLSALAALLQPRPRA
jgi:DNA-binding response OmpR family regulator